MDWQTGFQVDSLARLGAQAQRAGLGLYACVQKLDIRHVPFDGPCLILVLSGRKILYTPDGPVAAQAGELLAVPGPAAYDLRNELAADGSLYRALVIAFGHEHLDRLRKLHGLTAPAGKQPGVLRYRVGGDMLDAVRHYLAVPERQRQAEHRLLGLLLMLVEENPDLLAFQLAVPDWGGKVRAVLAEDLAREWDFADLCRRLAVGESTLRRHLGREGTSFRELLREARLGTALYRLQQGREPVQRIALDCGYRSVSRFTANFRERFGLTPTELRAAMAESG